MTYGATCLGMTRQRALPDFVDRTAVPPASVYDQWLQTQNPGARARYTGAMLRRAIVMLRRHETWPDIGRAVGKAAEAIRTQVARLPAELQ